MLPSELVSLLLNVCVHAKLLLLCLTLCLQPYGLWDHQAPLSMGFSRQEYWSGLLCPPPGDLPDLNIYMQLRKLENIIWGRHHNFAYLALISYSFSVAWFYSSRNIKILIFLALLNLEWPMSYNKFWCHSLFHLLPVSLLMPTRLLELRAIVPSGNCHRRI